jgi:hypothetical protein
VAETFLAAFRRRDHYDLTHSDARPWLYGIATRLIGRHRRQEVRFFRAIARTGVDPAAGISAGFGSRWARLPVRYNDRMFEQTCGRIRSMRYLYVAGPWHSNRISDSGRACASLLASGGPSGRTAARTRRRRPRSCLCPFAHRHDLPSRLHCQRMYRITCPSRASGGGQRPP